MKKLTYLCLLAVTVSMMAACGASYKEKQAERDSLNTEKMRKEKKALKIAVLPTMDCLPVWVAVDAGYFKDIPDSFLVKPLKSQIDIEHALLDKSVDVGASDTMRIDFVNSKEPLLAAMGNTELYWLLITNKGTRVSDPKNLGDKLVAMTRYSATDWLTDQVLAAHPSSATTFKIQVNDVEIRLQMLQNNAMDAMWLPEPQATMALMGGHKSIADSRKMKTYLSTFAMRTADKEDARRNRQVGVFVKGYNRACDSLNKHGLKAYAPLLKEHLGVDEKTLPRLPKFKFGKISN